MRAEFLPYSSPSIGEEEIAEVVDTLRSGWLTTGPKTRQFEADFAALLGAPGAVAVSSCTAALHTALVAMGIGPGDEVVTTAITFPATVNVIEHAGARPVLADVEPDTLNLDPASLAARITPRTRAVIPVHFAGHPAEMDAIRAIAEEHGLVVVEDAAHALPARYRGRLVGTSPNPAAFSFYATKNVTTGEGGMLTGDPEFLERARIVAGHGITRGAWERHRPGAEWRYDVVSAGFKYNMTDLQASLGIWQLRKLCAFQDRRRAIVRRYTEAFGESDALQLPGCRPEVEHAWHLYVLRLRPSVLRICRDRFVEEMRARRIGVAVHFIPVPLHSHYRGRFCAGDFPVATAAFEGCVSLPLHPGMTDRDVDDVVEAVLDVVRCHRR